MRRWLATMLIGTSLTACKVKKHENEPAKAAAEVDAMSPKTPSPEVVALRAEVVAKVELWGRHDYTPEDWSIIDPSIEWALSGNGPADPKNRTALIEAAAKGVVSALVDHPEGVAILEKKLTERYNRPVMTRDGDLVHIDLGVIAGKPSPFRGVLMVSSPLAENGSHGLIASEVVRNLKLGIAAHPDAQIYQVEVDIPGRWQEPGFTYVYGKAEDRIRLYQSGKTDYFYTTEILGGSLDKVTSLSWANLQQKAFDQMPVRSFDLQKKSR